MRYSAAHDCIVVEFCYCDTQDLKLTGLKLDDPRLQSTFNKLDAVIGCEDTSLNGGLPADKFKE